MDKLESMYAFTQVVEEGSFAAAARKMQMSRSYINKLVIDLENQLGVQLLYRTTRQVTPTDTGRAYYEHCVNILAAIDEVELAITQQNTEPKGTLKINAPMSFGIAYLAQKIADFMSFYRDIKIQLTLEDRFVDPIQEGYDLVLRIGSVAQSPNLVVQEITTIDRVICAAPSYLENKGIPQDIYDLKNHSCLHYGYLATGNQWQLKKGEEIYQISVNSICCCNNGQVLKDLAIRGLGIVLLPTFLIKPELEKKELQIILPDYYLPPLKLCLIYPVNRHLSTKIKLFTQFLTAVSEIPSAFH